MDRVINSIKIRFLKNTIATKALIAMIIHCSNVFFKFIFLLQQIYNTTKLQTLTLKQITKSQRDIGIKIVILIMSGMIGLEERLRKKGLKTDDEWYRWNDQNGLEFCIDEFLE